MKYIKVFLTKLNTNKSNDYWYVYTNQPSYSAQVSVGGSTSSFSVSIRDRGQTTTKVSQDITMWLSSDGYSDEECLLLRDTYGETCYLSVDLDGSMNLLSSSDFNNLQPSEQTVVTTLTQLSV